MPDFEDKRNAFVTLACESIGLVSALMDRESAEHAVRNCEEQLRIARDLRAKFDPAFPTEGWA